MAQLQIKKKQLWWMLGVIVLFGAMIRFLLAMSYLNAFDTEWYLKWAVDIQNGLLNAYDGHVRDLDYPPLYLLLLWPVGRLLNIKILATYQPYRMLLIKFWPILFDLLTIVALYLIFRKRSVFLALIASAVWALNPSAIFNCACWGQTDTIMTLQLLLVFAAFDENRPIWGTFLFAIAALTKMQCLYLAPVILFWFVRRRNWGQLLRALLVGFGTVIGVFLPFSIASANPTALFQIYFGGFGKYPYINLNAFNLYGLWEYNWVWDQTSLFGGTQTPNGLVGGFTFSMLGSLLMIGSIAFVAWVMLYGKKSNVWLHSALLMQCLFILTTRQHERYQFIVMIFLLAAFVTEQDFKILGLFAGICAITFLNQSLLLDKIIHNTAPYIKSFTTLQAIGSAANLILFVCTVLLCLHHAGLLRLPARRAKREEVLPQ